ncbi:MAG: hypothetical protein AB7I96_11220 [Candidatus Dadabacteria bacterium]
MNTITSSVAAKVFALILVVFFSVGGCGGSGDDEGGFDPDTRDIFVTLENPFSNEFPIHILSPGESLSPDNQLFPGESREVFLGSVQDGEDIIFRAGRNGIICIEIACTANIARDFFLVSFFEDDNLNFDLFCEDGLSDPFVIQALDVCPLL